MRFTRYSVAARADLKSIWRYGLQTFGAEIADCYLSELEAKLTLIASRPLSGPAVPGYRRLTRKYPVNRHVIYYEPLAGGVRIVRVLHQSMDARRHMR